MVCANIRAWILALTKQLSGKRAIMQWLNRCCFTCLVTEKLL